MSRGYDRTLYILPFDHRASFLKNLFGWTEPLNETRAAEVVAARMQPQLHPAKEG